MVVEIGDPHTSETEEHNITRTKLGILDLPNLGHQTDRGGYQAGTRELNSKTTTSIDGEK